MLNCSWFQSFVSDPVIRDPILDQFSMITRPFTRPNENHTLNQTKWLENHTLFSGTYPYNQLIYGSTPPPLAGSRTSVLGENLLLTNRKAQICFINSPLPLQVRKHYNENSNTLIWTDTPKSIKLLKSRFTLVRKRRRAGARADGNEEKQMWIQVTARQTQTQEQGKFPFFRLLL